MGCHLKYVEASAGIKQNLPGAVEHPPLTTSEVLLFFQLLQLCHGLGSSLLRLYLEAICFMEQLLTLEVSFASCVGASLS